MGMILVAAAAAAMISISIVLIWGLRFLNWFWIKPKKLEKLLRDQGFSGNSYRFLFGDSKDIAMEMNQSKLKPMDFSNHIAPRATPSLHLTINKFGKNSFTWIGPNPRVYITDPEQLKSVFSLINDFPKTSSPPGARSSGGGLFSLDGPKWAKHRKIINPAFHFEKLKGMFRAFSMSCSEMVDKWDKLVSNEEGWCELDVWPDLQNMTADVISRTAFGSNFKEGQRIFQILKNLAPLMMSVTLLTQRVQFIPGWRFLPNKINRRIDDLQREMGALVLGMIGKRQSAIEAGEVLNDDLLGILLESNLNHIREHGNNKDIGLSIEDVIKECGLFYFAGQETTAALLVWTMVLLGRYTEWQDQARAEVFDVFGNETFHFDGLSRLKVVTMILNEVLRLYPPLTMLSRAIHKETKLGNLTLPVGVTIGVPIIYIHQDPHIWGADAHEFRPQRFSEGISKATKNQVCFFPFGWGPRFCIGQNFAMIEAKLALSMILRGFSFELSPSYSHAPTSNITTQPQHGAHLILRKL